MSERDKKKYSSKFDKNKMIPINQHMNARLKEQKRLEAIKRAQEEKELEKIRRKERFEYLTSPKVYYNPHDEEAEMANRPNLKDGNWELLEFSEKNKSVGWANSKKRKGLKKVYGWKRVTEQSKAKKQPKKTEDDEDEDEEEQKKQKAMNAEEENLPEMKFVTKYFGK